MYPNVDFRSGVLVPEEDFGSGVRGRPAPRVQLVARRPEVAEAKVGDLDVALAIQQQVLRLLLRHPQRLRIEYINII